MKMPIFFDQSKGVSESVNNDNINLLLDSESIQKLYPRICNKGHLHLFPDSAVFMKDGYPICTINTIASDILMSINGTKTVSEVIEEMRVRYSWPTYLSFSTISAFLSSAKKRGMVTFSKTPTYTVMKISGSRNFFLPYTASLEITQACDLKCKYCYANGGLKKDKELSDNQWFSIIDVLSEGTCNISITGGDPLVRPGFVEIIEYAAKSGLNIKVLTNGMRVDKDVSKRLIETGINMVQISLDGYDALTHESIRGVKGCFEAAVAAISTLAKLGINVIVGMTVTAESVEYVPEVAKLAYELGASSLTVGRVLERGRAKGQNLEISQYNLGQLIFKVDEAARMFKGKKFAIAFDESSNWFETFTEKCPSLDEYILYRSRFHRCAGDNCGAGRLLIAISPSGEVRPCPVMETSLGLAITGGELISIMSKFSGLFGRLPTPCKEICCDCKYLFKCVGCHAEALEYSYKVPHCNWKENIKREGGNICDIRRNRLNNC